MHHHSSSCNHNVNFRDRQPQKIRLLMTVFVLISTFAGVELGVSYFSHSLALLADSGHLLSDCLALGLSVAAAWLSQIPGKQQWEAIAALVNSLSSVIIALWIGWEALTRLQSPPVEILSLPMLITAIAGLVINSISILLLHKDSQDDLNLRGAFLHVMADAISSVGVIIAAIAIATLHWLWADGAVSLAVAGVIMFSSLPLVVESTKALLKADLVSQEVSDL